jgi:hypothetical protein
MYAISFFPTFCSLVYSPGLSFRQGCLFSDPMLCVPVDSRSNRSLSGEDSMIVNLLICL